MPIVTTSAFKMHPLMTHISPGTMQIDAANEKATVILRAPKTGTIDRVLFRVGTVTAAEAGTLVRIETVDTSTGNPSGTLWGTDTSATVNVNAAGYFDVGLTAGAAVTKGDVFAIVVALPGTTSGNFTVLRGGNTTAMPYNNLFTGTWTKTYSEPMMMVRYSDGSWPFAGTYMANSGGNFMSLAIGAEGGNKITMPYGARITGVRAAGPNAGSTYEYRLYDAANTLLTSVTVPDALASQTSGENEHFFPTSVEVAAGAVIRLVRHATTASRIGQIGVPSAAHMTALPSGDISVVGTSRSSTAGAWTDGTNWQGMIVPIIDGIDLAGGGAPAAVERSYGYVG